MLKEHYLYPQFSYVDNITQVVVSDPCDQRGKYCTGIQNWRLQMAVILFSSTYSVHFCTKQWYFFTTLERYLMFALTQTKLRGRYQITVTLLTFLSCGFSFNTTQQDILLISRVRQSARGPSDLRAITLFSTTFIFVYQTRL